MKIFTATPCNFDGTQDFFDRDSGLLMCGLQQIGIRSKSITLGPAKPNDLPQMSRASWQELASAEWWANQKIDGLVFYNWGHPRYKHMVDAAIAAGIYVAQATDCQGIISPLSDWSAHIKSDASHHWYEARWKRSIRTFCRLAFSHSIRIPMRDFTRAKSIAASHYFFTATPSALVRYRRFLKNILGHYAAARVRLAPFPVNHHFRYLPAVQKCNEVIAVGRWDSLQKRTPLLLSTISDSFHLRDDVTYRIFGTIPQSMKDWHQSQSVKLRKKIILEGKVSNTDLAAAYQRARVMLVSSAYEGCHNASGEAVCSGATVVACKAPALDALAWHASRESGRLADQPTSQSLSRALFAELDAWERGERDPSAISNSWVADLHTDQVARKIINLFNELPSFNTP